MKDENEKTGDGGVKGGDAVYDAEIVGEAPSQEGKAPWLPPQRPLWMDLLIIIGVYLGSTILVGLFLGLIASLLKGDITRAGLVATTVVNIVTIVVGVWLLRKRGMKKPILSFSFKKANPLMILWGFLLMFIMGVVIEPLLELFPARYMEDLNNMIIGTGGLGMLTTVILAPLFEEMLFRGVIQGGAAREYGPIRGILVAAAIFGIVHLVPQQVVNAFFAGIIMGYIFYRTGSLIPVIAIHMLNNAIAYIMMRMAPDSAGMTTREMIGSDVWYWILYGVCAVIFVLALVNVWRQLNKADRKAELETT